MSTARPQTEREEPIGPFGVLNEFFRDCMGGHALGLDERPAHRRPPGHPHPPRQTAELGLALLIASIPYTILAAYVCVASCFRASDVHQLLPALLPPLLVWSLFAFQLFNGPDVAAPPEVLYTFLLGGPLSVTALSAWEVWRLRSRYGITLRGALGR